MFLLLFAFQDTVCLEGGAYFLNYQHCVHCNKKQELKIQNKEVSENDEEEVITYQRKFPHGSPGVILMFATQ